MTGSVKDGSLAAAVLERGTPSIAVPAALIEACGLPEIGSRLGHLSVRIDDGISRPFTLDGSIITVRPDVAADLGSAASALREAIELSTLGGGRISWSDRILAFATAAVFARTGLFRRLHATSGPHPVLALDVFETEDLERSPRRTATRIARFLERRDNASVSCPEVAIEASARAISLAVPTQVLLATGGDDRQRVDWSQGVNTYGIAPRPTPWTAMWGSCTASSPTYRGFDAAAQLKYRLIEAALVDRLDEAVAAETKLVRTMILAALGVTDDGIEVVLTPSGTDAELVALSLSLAAGAPIRSIVLGANEIGRGSLPAAGGRHFTETLPSGRLVPNGEIVAGIDPRAVSVVEIPLRDEDGELLPPGSVEDRIEAELTAAPDRVLLHVVEGSKTGVRLPRADAVANWQRREGGRLDVVVDAAQMRIAQDTVAVHLQAGRMVFVTGSKFFGGPPFSGALLIPGALADRARSGRTFPRGLGDYLTHAEVPDSLPGLRKAGRPGTNYGLLARWSAALAEMQSFHNASWEIRDEVLRNLAAGLRRTLAAAPHVEIVESPYTRIPETDRRGLDDLPTIFTFLVRRGGGHLDLEQAKVAHRLLANDARAQLGTDGEIHPTASRSFHLGQPVKIARNGDHWIAGLRFAIGATTISRVVFDHTLGERWTDRVERELADVKDALTKLALILAHVDFDACRGRPGD